jgi:NSS family neurotransmitter:Na+ symporter
MQEDAAGREQWGSRLGFLLAAIGSAVGLGNMWRFSYLASAHGGAAFVLLYLGTTAFVALPILLAELVLGRGARRSPIQALRHFGGARWAPLGWLFVASGFLILSYYSVIAGWTLRYSLSALAAGFEGDPAVRFREVATGWDAVAGHGVFLAVTIAVVAGGVKQGLERTNLIMMPALFGIVAGLAFYAATVDGGGPGYLKYLKPQVREVLSLEVLSQAAGQAFFSLSLGMGAMLTYASYLDRTHHLPNESLAIATSDFLVAFAAGLVVFPLIFAFGLEEKVGSSTVGALFITLPEAFGRMGAAGRIVGFLFFLTLVFGALTSAISLLEVVVASAMDGLGWGRPRAALALGAAAFVLGIPPALDLDVLGWMDQLAGNVFLVLGALGLSIFVGWVMADPVSELEAGAPGVRWFALWRTILRWATPPILALVLLQSLRTLYGG